MNHDPLSGVAEFYDDEAAAYDSLRWQGPIGELVHATYHDLVTRAIADASGTALEIGPGTGRFTVLLAQRGMTVVAVDVSEEMLAAARAALARAGLADAVNLRVGDARALTRVTADRFDVVCSFNAINHIPDYEAAMRQMAGRVRSGGLLVLGFPSLYSLYLPYAILVNARGRSLRRGVYTKWVSVPSVVRLLRREGFEPKAEFGMFHAPPLASRPHTARIAAVLLGALNLLVKGGRLRCIASTRIMVFRKT